MLRAGRGPDTAAPPQLLPVQPLCTADDAPGRLLHSQQLHENAFSTPAEPSKMELRCCSCFRPCAHAAYLVWPRPCRSSCPAASLPAEPSLRCSRTKLFSRTSWMSQERKMTGVRGSAAPLAPRPGPDLKAGGRMLDPRLLLHPPLPVRAVRDRKAAKCAHFFRERVRLCSTCLQFKN